MLRASVEARNGTVDLSAVSVGARDDAVGVRHAAPLTAFAEAAVRFDAAALATARNALRAASGAAALVDAAAVIGNFERMTRIADGTGIPLERASTLASSDFRGALGLETYPSAANTPRAGFFARLLAPLWLAAAKRMLQRMFAR
jgi:hypothetical protein